MDNQEIREGTGNPVEDMSSAAEALDKRVPSDTQYPWWVAVATPEGLSMASNMDEPHIWLVKGLLSTGSKGLVMQTMAFILSILPSESLDRVEEALNRVRENREG